eukprot:15238508-Alexandrium_andersonii.AAC.1
MSASLVGSEMCIRDSPLSLKSFPSSVLNYWMLAPCAAGLSARCSGGRCALSAPGRGPMGGGVEGLAGR